MSASHGDLDTAPSSAARRQQIDLKDTEDAKSKEWDRFLSLIDRCGWLLPGPCCQVGRAIGSSKVQWDESFRTSDVFDNLQYAGEKNIVNTIPSLKVNSEALAAQEVHAELSNSQIYVFIVKDLDEITLTNKNRYQVTDPVTKKSSDVVVKEEVLFAGLASVWTDLERVCFMVNEYADAQRNIQP
jgi:hypothetical protein